MIQSKNGRFIYYYDSPLGRLGFMEEDGRLKRVLYADTPFEEGAVICETPLIYKAFSETNEYLNGRRKTFDLPIAANGTPFQCRVWNAIRAIPYGQTISYQTLAVQIGSPKAVRAVGLASFRNPLPIVIPCHRVIGKGRDVTGYAGSNELKQSLLDLELRYTQ